MNEPFVSVIVSVKDGDRTIDKCINSIINLDYSNYEIIIVDDKSEDKTREILNRYKDKIRIIYNQNNLGPSKSRNIAACQSRADYIAFTDADCIVDKYWLKELLKGFIHNDVVSVGGRQDIPEDETNFGKKVFQFMRRVGFITDYMRKGKNDIIFVEHNPSCNVMYKKDTFLKEKGFNERLWPGEDVELDYRLRRKGYKLVFNPKAVVYHYRPENIWSFIKMMYRYGKTQGLLVRKYGFFRKIHILPFVLSLSIVLFLFKPWTIFPLVLFILLFFKFNLFIFFLAVLAFFVWNIGFLKGVHGKI